ncbi:MAG: hypothetical protein EOO36_15635, partial [Cytophagaceae bacterium]
MSFFLTRRFFYLFTAFIAGFVVAFFLPWLLGPMRVLLGAAALLTLLDALLLAGAYSSSASSSVRSAAAPSSTR